MIPRVAAIAWSLAGSSVSEISPVARAAIAPSALLVVVGFLIENRELGEAVPLVGGSPVSGLESEPLEEPGSRLDPIRARTIAAGQVGGRLGEQERDEIVVV